MKAEIKDERQYATIIRNKDILLLRLDILQNKPCSNYYRYKGLRSPQCMCRSCADEYIACCKAKGYKVETTPKGWRPF